MKRLFRSLRPNPKRDVRSELTFHLDMRAAEFRTAGMSEEDARRAAIEAFGDVAAIDDELAAARQAQVDERQRRDRIQELRADIAFAFRTFGKNTGFTAAALATLALGIGATIAVFTVVNGVLLRPLPYADPSRIAMIWMSSAKKENAGVQLPVSSGFFINARETTHAFSSMAAFRSWGYSLTANGDAEQVAGARVTPALFTVLGVRPLLGHAFAERDAEPGAPKVVMLSHSLWQRRFGGRASVIGSTIQLGSDAFTVVGVMPEGFAFPRGAELPSGMQFGLRTELWTPMVFDASARTAYGTLNIAAVGRLKPGVTIEQARADLSTNLKNLLAPIAPNLGVDFESLSIQDQAGGPVRRGLWLLMGAVAFVLFIACANVTNLLVARTAARRRELAMRAALGAGRARIARQLITENVVLAVLGTSIGLALSVWVTRAMLAMVPGSLPRSDDVRVDWRVALVSLALAIAAGAVFGVLSTLQIRLGDLAATLREAGARMTSDRGRSVGRRGLVTIEVALSVMLVIGAGLLAVSFSRLQNVEAGIDPERVLTAAVALPVVGNFDPQRDGAEWSRFFGQLNERVAALPGVVAAGATSALPLTHTTESGSFAVVGRPAPASGQASQSDYAVIEGEYFRAAGIRQVAGRLFESRDEAKGTPVAIVNREFARRTFGDSVVLGRQLITYFDFSNGAARTIVGIVDDTRQAGLDAPVRPIVYVPERQMPYFGLKLVVKTAANPLALVPALKQELKAIDPRLALSEVRAMNEVVSDSLARQRFSMTVLTIFAGLALLLATVGLYGVIALSVGQRRREIGVRMALGASPGAVVNQILGEGMRMTLAGVALGLIGALAASRLLNAMLFGIEAMSLPLYAVAVVPVVTVAVIATWVPARRATRVDPTMALRD